MTPLLVFIIIHSLAVIGPLKLNRTYDNKQDLCSDYPNAEARNQNKLFTTIIIYCPMPWPGHAMLWP